MNHSLDIKLFLRDDEVGGSDERVGSQLRDTLISNHS